MGYTIMTDSACNLPLSMLEKENAKIIPMTYYAKDDSRHLLKTTDIDTFDGTIYYNMQIEPIENKWHTEAILFMIFLAPVMLLTFAMQKSKVKVQSIELRQFCPTVKIADPLDDFV